MRQDEAEHEFGRLMSQPPPVNQFVIALDMQGSVTRQSMVTLTLNHNIESQRGTLNMDLSHSFTWPRTT